MSPTETEELEDQIRKLIANHLDLPLDGIDLDMSVEEAANSLELSTLMFAAEQQFGITLPDSAVGRLRVLRDLVTVVSEARS